MTDAKYEAPAEGAGERYTEGSKLPDGAISGTDDGQTVWLESSTGGAHRLGIWGGLSLRFEEADGSSVVRDYEDVNIRARSSAPEAREEALGNLLAVIHGDGGHRALEVGVEQAAAEAEKIVANLLSSAPEAREGEAVKCRANMDTVGDCSTRGGCDCPPQQRELRDVVKGIDADYMTSETHHPGYVLIPAAKFDAIVGALREEK